MRFGDCEKLTQLLITVKELSDRFDDPKTNGEEMFLVRDQICRLIEEKFPFMGWSRAEISFEQVFEKGDLVWVIPEDFETELCSTDHSNLYYAIATDNYTIELRYFNGSLASKILLGTSGISEVFPRKIQFTADGRYLLISSYYKFKDTSTTRYFRAVDLTTTATTFSTDRQIDRGPIDFSILQDSAIFIYPNGEIEYEGGKVKFRVPKNFKAKGITVSDKEQRVIGFGDDEIVIWDGKNGKILKRVQMRCHVYHNYSNEVLFVEPKNGDLMSLDLGTMRMRIVMLRVKSDLLSFYDLAQAKLICADKDGNFSIMNIFDRRVIARFSLPLDGGELTKVDQIGGEMILSLKKDGQMVLRKFFIPELSERTEGS